MNRNLQRFWLIAFLIIFSIGAFAPLLKSVNKIFRGLVTDYSATPSPASVTTAGSQPDYFTFKFKPSPDVTYRAFPSGSPGVVLNFGTYGYNISSADLFSSGGFWHGDLSLVVNSSSQIYLYGINNCSYADDATEHTVVISNIKNPNVSGLNKVIKIILNAAGALSTDTGDAILAVGPGDVSKYSLTTSTTLLTAGSAAPVTVKALDTFGNVNTGYNSQAIMTQTGGTDSSITYSGTGVTNNTLGTSFWTSGQGVVSISNAKTENVNFTLTDAANSSIVGTLAINWNNAGSVTQLVPDVQSNPSPVAGTQIVIRLQAEDASGNINTKYNGNGGVVNITQSGGTANKISYTGDCLDMADGTGYIPSSKWLSNGYVTINIQDNNVEGPVTFTFREASNPTIVGTLSVTWRKGGATYFTITPSKPSPAPGESVFLNVKAYTATNDLITDYSGSGSLSAVQTGTGTAQRHVRWNGTGVTMDDQNQGAGQYISAAWSGGVANFELVNYISGIQTVGIVTSTSSGESGTGRSSEVTWRSAPKGTVKLKTSSRDIPPNNATVSELISDDIYDTDGNRTPDGTVFTVMTNLGSFTDTDVNPALPELQVATADGKIKAHLKSGTIGVAQVSTQSLSLTPPVNITTSTQYLPSATGDTRIMVSPLKVNSVSSPVAQVEKGDTSIPVEIEVENISASAVSVDQVKPVFYKEISSGYDVTGEYDITPDSSNPASIAAGSKAKFKFAVAVTRLQTNGTIILDAIVQLSGSTIKFTRWLEENSTLWNTYAKTTDTWVATGGEAHTTDLPNYIYQIKSTHGNTSSLFKSGDYIPVHSGLEITFFDSGYRINPLMTEVRINDVVLSLNSSYFYNESTGVLTVPDVGDKDGTLTLKLKDISGNTLPDATIAFKVNANLSETRFLCYPNPVRAGQDIKIGFQLSLAATCKIYIFNSSAELVWASDTFEGVVGYNEISWDGINVRGNIAGGGIYTLRLVATDKDGHQIIGRTKLGIL